MKMSKVLDCPFRDLKKFGSLGMNPVVSMSAGARMTIKGLLLFFIFFFTSCGYHPKPVVSLPKIDQEKERTLFIAIDGLGYDMIHELKSEGYFKDFQDPIPMIVTYPSATTTSFTGIFQSLKGGKAPGYEIRFFSHEENRVMGGTPKDIYKIDIPYKHYFDAFRFTMFKKAVMYGTPDVAGRQDLEKAEKLLYSSDKKVLMAYLGGSDGAQHVLGRLRMKRFMKYVDWYIARMKTRYEASGKGPLRVVFFSDHGFHFDRLKMIGNGPFKEVLEPSGYKLSSHLNSQKDVVAVEFGLLSAGVLMTKSGEEGAVAHLVHAVKGLDLTFWPTKNQIHIIDSLGSEAYFEYKKENSFYRYQTVTGDPLKLLPLLKEKGFAESDWISDQKWFELTSFHYYPDPGHRLYAAYHTLVDNTGSVLFSTKPKYQFGSYPALAATYFKFGHKGTHGGLFWEPSAGSVMTDDKKIKLPKAIRYDQFFDLFIPNVTKAFRTQ